MDIKKGDTVQIMAGKDRGKTGTVLKVLPKQGRILVEGLNTYKKHTRPKRQGEKGEIVIISRPITGSNVMMYCSKCKKGVRLQHQHVKKGVKKRICVRCKTIF